MQYRIIVRGMYEPKLSQTRLTVNHCSVELSTVSTTESIAFWHHVIKHHSWTSFSTTVISLYSQGEPLLMHGSPTNSHFRCTLERKPTEVGSAFSTAAVVAATTPIESCRSNNMVIVGNVNMNLFLLHWVTAPFLCRMVASVETDLYSLWDGNQNFVIKVQKQVL